MPPTNPNELSPFDRFKALAEKLLAVPKSEIKNEIKKRATKPRKKKSQK